MHLVHNGCCPRYLSDLVTACADLPCRQHLRSASSRHYDIPPTSLKFGERAFSYAAPVAWNSLPGELQRLDDTNTFKKQLKSHLFTSAFAR